jgi:hypothetical protein
LENDKRSDRPSIEVKDKFCRPREALSPITGMSSAANIDLARTVKLSLNYSFDLQKGFSPRSKVEEDLKFSNETMKCGAQGRKSFARQPALSRGVCVRNRHG